MAGKIENCILINGGRFVKDDIVTIEIDGEVRHTYNGRIEGIRDNGSLILDISEQYRSRTVHIHSDDIVSIY